MDKNCKLVKDLLPSYIDDVTSKETKEFIEEHLKECKDCKKHLDEMNSELDKEKVKDIETVKEIKKYKRKIFTLKFLVIAAVLIIVGTVVGKLGYKYYIVKNSIEHSFINEGFFNYRIDEFDESIEGYKEHYTTYITNGHIKKEYDGKVLEYWDGSGKRYIINEDEKTYYVEEEYVYDPKEKQFNPKLIEDLNIIPAYKELVVNKESNPIKILKFILTTDDIYIGREGFRDEEYYIIKTDYDGVKIFIDMDTFYVERLTRGSSWSKEFRVSENCVRYHSAESVDLTGYTEIKK